MMNNNILLIPYVASSAVPLTIMPWAGFVKPKKNIMSEFKQYRRKQIAELRPFQEGEKLSERVSVSQTDQEAGSPKVGDMIARNPKNHNDQWLVAKDYYEENFGEIKMDFGQAIEAAKQGKRVARQGWNGKGMFIFQRPADKLDKDFIPKVKSLPETVKTFLVEQGRDIEFLAYLCMWSATGEVVNGWLASQTDMLSNDWCILD